MAAEEVKMKRSVPAGSKSSKRRDASKSGGVARSPMTSVTQSKRGHAHTASGRAKVRQGARIVVGLHKRALKELEKY